MKRRPYYIPAAILAIVLAACNDTCTENKNALPLAGFYISGSGTNTTVSIDSLEVRGVFAPGDTVLSAPTENKSSLYLPFRIDNDTTIYYFGRDAYGDYQWSEVTFIYSRTPRFADVECGVSYIYDIKKIECIGSLIDSVTCPKGFIDNQNIQNLNIYFSGSVER